MRLLVTGASGFVAQAVARRAVAEGWTVRGATRSAGYTHDGVEVAIVGDLSASTDWQRALEGVDAVIHTAARVHVMRERATDPLGEFRRVNVDGTRRLATQAVDAGVRRFVFVSSIKVNGESTRPGRPFTSADPPNPVDPYGISKLEAERALFDLARASALEVSAVRPVLVYGPGVKGNFRSMMAWICRGIPLPFGAADNRRSLVALGNLSDLLVRCAYHPAATGRAWLVSDGEDMATALLIRRLAAALGRPARLLPVPPALVTAVARAVGQGGAAERLFGSLQVDMSDTQHLLSWTPPETADEALRGTALDFLGRTAA